MLFSIQYLATKETNVRKPKKKRMEKNRLNESESFPTAHPAGERLRTCESERSKE